MPTPKSCKASCTTVLVLAVLGLLLCLPALAQEEAPNPPLRTVVKALKYADVEAIRHLLELVEVEVAVEPMTRQIVIRGPNSRMETALALADALDTPEPAWGIELRVHLVTASKEPVAGPGVPADLESALDELTELFGYRGFEQVDTILLFASTDAGGAQLSAPIRDGAVFHVGFDGARVIYGEPKNHVLFENLTVKASAAEISLRTNVKVLEDHKVLIGKTSLRSDEKDLVLVIEARLKGTWPRDEDG